MMSIGTPDSSSWTYVDALSADKYDDTVAWYDHTSCTPAPTPTPAVECVSGTVAFSEHVITTLADDGQSVFAVDVDGDGDADILTASNYDDDGDVDVLGGSEGSDRVTSQSQTFAPHARSRSRSTPSARPRRVARGPRRTR
ncbi:hypothetical protein JL721_3205 [Aureococcus anophagefferens]|nr:hypothetical protein JL721_3205 [Aureococcus anophagefferens]